MSINDVQEFHRKFDLPDGTQPSMELLDKDTLQFRAGFMEEEIREFREAHEEGDLLKAFDALLDAAYVVYGTALMMGIEPKHWKQGFTVVHECNMRKVRARSTDESKRGSTLDVVKPEGWTGPDDLLHLVLTGDLSE